MAEELPGQLKEPSDLPTRELTLDEAVSFAILLQKNEQLVERTRYTAEYSRLYLIILARCTTPVCSHISKAGTTKRSCSSSGASR